MYVFLPNGELLATVERNGTATSTYIAHTDHQGGTNVMSDKGDAYYPFGAKKNNELPANGFVEKARIHWSIRRCSDAVFVSNGFTLENGVRCYARCSVGTFPHLPVKRGETA